jgi:hypothetical protein
MITEEDYNKLSKEFNIPAKNIKKVVKVESGGKGFAEDTGKIIIQFEPSWFKRRAPYTPSGKWSLNGVEKQKAEWEAFNDAFVKNPNATMESTSVGLMQVMGFHYRLTGFKTVGEMWDYAKESEVNQLRLGLLFIASNTKMRNALKTGDWETFAFYYNGAQWK